MDPLKREHYDLIFLGAGLGTLSLLMRMIRSGQFSDKQILLIDRDDKKANDRTWCYWEIGEGFFEEIVYKKWPSIRIIGKGQQSDLALDPYRYKMIRGKDLYHHCFREINKQANIAFVKASVGDFKLHRDGIHLQLDGQWISLGCGEVFNSIYVPDTAQKKAIRLLQHFKGWMIETEEPFFDPSVATMMDFRVHQRYGTSFGYVLPVTSTKAMVEYTQFTKALLQPEEYEKELKEYVEQVLGIKHYRVLETEFGVIPMTSEKFIASGKGWNLGTAGGQTKASSGYTFQFVQKHSDRLLEKLISKTELNTLSDSPARFRFYDKVLLHVLYHHTYPGDKIFSRMFSKNKVENVFRFLDNESSLKEELAIISSMPAWPFLKAAFLSH